MKERLKQRKAHRDVERKQLHMSDPRAQLSLSGLTMMNCYGCPQT